MTENLAAPPVRRGVPLRVTLVAALLALVTIGLLASGVATTTYMRDFLTHRADSQLIDASGPFLRRADQPSFAPRSPPVPAPAEPVLRGPLDSLGNIVTVVDDPAASADVQPDFTGTTPSLKPVTVGSHGGSSIRWRMISAPYTLTDGTVGTIAIATSLADVSSPVDRLILLQSAIGLAVLLILGALAYLVVRRSLRPLVAVETTAAAIAAGDLHRRVPDAGSRTDVGRLSGAACSWPGSTRSARWSTPPSAY